MPALLDQLRAALDSMCCKDMTEIPNADSFIRPRKKGSLLKLTGKGWLYSGSWKKRFCVLDGTKFYFYENEKSKGTEKSSGVINLDYYDVCEVYDVKDKKNPHIFIIATSVRGFFDNRHQFAADCESDMQDWIRSVHDVITEARTVRSRAGRHRISSGNNDHLMGDDGEHNNLYTEEPEQLVNATKGRVRGPQGRRLPQRKSMMPMKLPTDGIEIKQRSFSLSSPNEDNEENASDSSASDGRRVSLSMDAMDRDEKMQDDASNNNARSSSSYEISSKGFANDAKKSNSGGALSTKKGILGKLGGQHAALTKELEQKLKSGLAPGGRKLHVQESTEDNNDETNQKQEILDLHKKINQQDTDLGLVRANLEALERRIEEMSTFSSISAQSTQSIITQVHDILSETAIALKDVQDTTAQCERVLEELQEAKIEHKRLLGECKEFLTAFRAIPLPEPKEEEF